MKGSIIRPLLMVVFVFLMVYLMELKIEESKEFEIQQTEIDPNSVIYSDIGLESEEILVEDEEWGEIKNENLTDCDVNISETNDCSLKEE